MRPHPTDDPARSPPALDDCVALLHQIDRLRAHLDEFDAHDAPPGWTAQELASMSWLASMFLTRLLCSATQEVRSAYLAFLADVQRHHGG